MRKLIAVTIAWVITMPCFAQEPPPIQAVQLTPIQEPTAQIQTPGRTDSGTITIPPGTTIPVTLTTSIRIKSTRRGDVIRAVTAFPVTVGTQVAIPAGTFVEGVFEKLPKSNSTGQALPVVHFTRIVFSNGYSLSIAAEMTEARAISPDTISPVVATIPEEKFAGGPRADLDAEPAGQLQPPPPLPKPNLGAITGIAIGAFVTIGVISILAIHHRGSYDAVAYDAGTQFDIVLQAPLALDATRVSAAVVPAQ